MQDELQVLLNSLGASSKISKCLFFFGGGGAASDKSNGRHMLVPYWRKQIQCQKQQEPR